MADLKKKKKEKCASRFCVALKIVRTKRTREGEEEEGLFFSFIYRRKKISQMDFVDLLPPPPS